MVHLRRLPLLPQVVIWRGNELQDRHLLHLDQLHSNCKRWPMLVVCSQGRHRVGRGWLLQEGERRRTSPAKWTSSNAYRRSARMRTRQSYTEVWSRLGKGRFPFRAITFLVCDQVNPDFSATLELLEVYTPLIKWERTFQWRSNKWTSTSSPRKISSSTKFLSCGHHDTLTSSTILTRSYIRMIFGLLWSTWRVAA